MAYAGFENQTRTEGSVRLHIHGFTTEYKNVLKKNDVTGQNEMTVVEIDVVEYSPAGQEALTVIKRPVAEVLNIEPNDDPGNLMKVQAWQRRSLVENRYLAWKGTGVLVENGTPLGAWPGINSKAADIIRQAGIHTVEDLATASESQIMRVRLPNQRDLREQARRFCSLKPQAADASKLGKLEEDNERLKEQLAEMKIMLMGLAKQQAPQTAAPADDEDDELEVVRELAREKGIARVGNKSKDTLLAELEAMEGKAA